jgi:hypothetical protein
LRGQERRHEWAQQAHGKIGDELEAIARMIEAEGAAWPEDVERLRSLAERVRARAALRSGLEDLGPRR